MLHSIIEIDTWHNIIQFIHQPADQAALQIYGRLAQRIHRLKHKLSQTPTHKLTTERAPYIISPHN